jgi:hypothetical protein
VISIVVVSKEILWALGQNGDSSVGIALGCGLDDRGSRVRFPAEAGNFSLHHRVQTVLRPTQPPIQWVPGSLTLGVKRPSSTEVKE